jgi:hypothetical protein
VSQPNGHPGVEAGTRLAVLDLELVGSATATGRVGRVRRRTGFAELRSATPINALQPAFMACTASSLINDCGHLTYRDNTQ